METLSKEILIALKGRRSTKSLSAQLGYKSNQVSRWETGHSRFLWTDFVDLCQRLGLSPSKLLETYEFHESALEIERLFSYLVPNKNKSEIAKVCGVSPLTLNRWFSKKSSPSVDKVFNLFIKSGTPLTPLIQSALMDRKMTPKLLSLLRVQEEKISVMMERPWTIAIACRCLQVDLKGMSFRQALAHLSKDLQLEPALVSETIHRLMRARLLRFSRNRDGFTFPEGPAHYEFRGNFRSFIEGAKFWLENSASMLNRQQVHKPGENHVSYLVFSLKSSEVKNVHKKVISLYKDLADISQENEKSNQCDRTFSFLMCLNQLDGIDFGSAVKKRITKG